MLSIGGGAFRSLSLKIPVPRLPRLSPGTDYQRMAQQYRVNKTEEEWRNTLSPSSYQVLREAGTERPFQNEYWDNHRKGKYNCRACDRVLFDSDHKFDSGTGWPSFYKAATDDCVSTRQDTRHGICRTEVLCKDCGSHLGHLFADAPTPTGLRYCCNSASLKFKPDRKWTLSRIGSSQK
eukprot:Gregarina_sp_Pseudo_9__1896@NODE_22_length_5725_cov_32_771720_g20_i0_p4_GENE_NODE_22_length_5725_cov_32_771720_g20_i0NODE_22_length_5725_cov_32_771720_g20_i0_p4_ORF_typecomplete_len179_score25_13SelR/PF01641_18/5e50YippeeMis18/PF03226_14/0_00029HECT_2/PF09814_9/11HECT_2/PF09814_9/0_32GFA/PF04828_14/62GFA/PF04828_14/0_81TF_Zn_Ribbon/PF08271_12/9_2e02TF_Zn_Ribbon/PF08271_12/2TF_Zn_Ribbon/PF08271_12/27_NODE_22_length_5725_cov_32_771720_g20_i029923528